MRTFKQILVKTCKEQKVSLGFVSVCGFVFYFKLNKYGFYLFLDKKRYYMTDGCFCMKLRVVWLF